MFFESPRGVFPNTEFVFDLELPEDFVPGSNDGEVDEFVLVPIADVADIVCSDKFKTTSCPMVVDFLIRHGVVNAENGTHIKQARPLTKYTYYISSIQSPTYLNLWRTCMFLYTRSTDGRRPALTKKRRVREFSDIFLLIAFNCT